MLISDYYNKHVCARTYRKRRDAEDSNLRNIKPLIQFNSQFNPFFMLLREHTGRVFSSMEENSF